jgi:hypothetical protein|tara:strand:+ start:664 stop:837 length:174 start_codon:yes stop_codon:yes gene_type:complete
MNATTTDKKQVKKPVSYGGHEHRVLDMEQRLMNHYGYNYSQLHKVLVREKYYQLNLL